MANPLLFTDALYKLVREHQKRARELLAEHESELPSGVVHLLDDVAVIIRDAQREALPRV